MSNRLPPDEGPSDRDGAGPPLPVTPELGRLFARTCALLGRDADDVLSEMLDQYLDARGPALASGLSAEPAPGPPLVSPLCRNAHEQIRGHRIAKRIERIRRKLEPAAPDARPGRSSVRASRQGARTGGGAPPPLAEAMRAVAEARARRAEIAARLLARRSRGGGG
ncbi:MAG: hypothetical protein HY744_29195 [Deltaproteobacteria bacterium]|nr:hypothetical protein [Deltaproteobacteria bacterium]